MTARRGIMGLLAGGVLAALSGCSLIGSNSYRFRMTVEVVTPDGLRSASSVYEVVAGRTLALTSEEAKGFIGIRGEALVVDLPSGLFFVTLKMPVAGRTLAGAVTLALVPGSTRLNMASAVRSLGGLFANARADLPRKEWPLLVRFADIADPMSAEVVTPETIGVRRIVVETTGEDVTTGIEQRLNWLGADKLTLGKGGSKGPGTGAGYLENRSFWDGTKR